VAVVEIILGKRAGNKKIVLSLRGNSKGKIDKKEIS
jgi:hypothetical protein